VIISEEGYDFCFDASKCDSCGGYCCRGESGYIWVKYQEMENIAKKLSISLEDFAIIYLKKVGHRYSLLEKQLGEDDYACIFFDESINRCSIYDVRPNQCRTFPFWQQFKNDKDEVRNQCPGII
jgi:uncharacterized protein